MPFERNSSLASSSLSVVTNAGGARPRSPQRLPRRSIRFGCRWHQRAARSGGEEPFSLSSSEAPNKRVLPRSQPSRTLYALISGLVKLLLHESTRPRSEVLHGFAP